MANIHHITESDHMFVGDDRIIRIRVYEDHDPTVPLNVNGHDLMWILKHSDESPTVLISKSTGGSPGGGIVVTGTFDADPDLNQQEVVITLTPADSVDAILGRKNYRYALKRTNVGAASTLMLGDFQWLYATTAHV